MKSKMQDELYKLDYEDIVAGMPTRFKYRTVEPNDYGLTTQEILFARDGTLKQFVSLKKMAPYNELEFQVGGKKRRKFREQLKHELEEQIDNSTDHISESVVEEADQEAEYPRKKKARRLKKGKKKDKGSSPADSTPNVAIDEVSSPSLKKGRKKRGKKAVPSKNQETADSDSHMKTEEQPMNMSNKLESPVSADKKRKKKRKKHKSFTGVTSSRLASYGL